MREFTVEFAPAAERDLKKIDPHLRSQLLHACKILSLSPYPMQSNRIKLLMGIVPVHFRLRVQDYRIVYRVEENRVIVVRVAHRKEAYR